MKLPVSPSLTSLPVLVGLFAALLLAGVCNAFLDIRQGNFGIEVFLWTLACAASLVLGWRQHGVISNAGRRGQAVGAFLGLTLLVFFFLPIWGIPRALVPFLATLQIAQNCVMTTRRHLHLGLFISLMMVVYASTHPRADWTMLFYLIPYVIAVVFTLAAEQIGRRAEDVRRTSVGAGPVAGQGVAILAATAAILLGGVLLYAVTPQLTKPVLFSKYGQPGHYAKLDAQPGVAQGEAVDGVNAATGERASGGEGGMDGIWPTLAQMREAADRPGMPKWQATSIRGMADVAEAGNRIMRPLRLALEDGWRRLKAWLDAHRQVLQQSLLGLIVLALLVAAWLLLKETRPVAWLRVRFDYLRLVMLERHGAGRRDALEYYAALQRLLDLEGLPRLPQVNSREYLAQICRRYEHLRCEAEELTLQFERARYGDREGSSADPARMRDLYRSMFHGVDLAAALRRI